MMLNNLSLTPESLYDFVEGQLKEWSLAEKNYSALRDVKRKRISLGNYDTYVQFNPSRIVSTGAKVSDGKVAERPCFLCSVNRPPEQKKIEILPGWELLVNPFPIFPIHFTIASSDHRPQDAVPFEIVSLAEKLEGMTVFFNGARAGASAPDHLHVQAVLTDELPLMKEAEKIHSSTNPGIYSSRQLDSDVPFLFFSGIVERGKKGMATLLAGLKLGGLSQNNSFDDSTKVNSFFWIDRHGLLRFVVIPRTAHRPSCYFAEDSSKLLVSPGCIDMAGVVITPREEDYKKVEKTDILKVYSEVTEIK